VGEGERGVRRRYREGWPLGLVQNKDRMWRCGTIMKNNIE